MSGDHLLEVEGVGISFGGVHAVREFSLALPAGDRVAVIGPNGAGKSTLMNLIAGVLTPHTGDIRFDGRSIRRVSADGRARRGIARTFQNLELFSSMTVLENVEVALDAQRRILAPWQGSKHLHPRRQLAREALALFEIEQYASVRTESLPYGIRKLLELSRALVTDPRLLLLDEPVAGLDDQAEFVGILSDALTQRDVTLILVEHDMPTVRSLSRYVHVMDAGRVIAEGPYEKVAADPRVIEAYLGKSAESQGDSR